jgi:hypothetical protein
LRLWWKQQKISSKSFSAVNFPRTSTFADP